MTVAIYSRGLDAEQIEPLQLMLQELCSHKVNILLYKNIYDLLSTSAHTLASAAGVFSNAICLVQHNVSCLISVGGDGTMLDAVTLVQDSNIPILGVNFGRLGFLACISKDDIAKAVDAIVNHSYIIDKRSLIHVNSDRPNLFDNNTFALNEFAIHKQDISPMIKIHTYINGEFLNTYWADGLIVSTPTGSTGYNLSCNGPILFPESACFIITPVAPHNLNVRPLVVADNNIISFEVEGRAQTFICNLDARREIVPITTQLAVKKESFMVNLIRLQENTFLSTLRNKLNWGIDKRN